MAEPTEALSARHVPGTATRRYEDAQRAGLRLAIACRTAIAAVAFIWYLGIVGLTDLAPRIAALSALGAFVAIGVAHLALMQRGRDRWWMKYAIYAFDILAVCAFFALVPVSAADEVPQIIAFRAYGIYYLFPFVAMAALSLNWQLVTFTGLMGVAGWWTAFLYVASQLATPLSWADMPNPMTREAYETIFLSINFVGTGNRVEETGLFLGASLTLALAVYRSRQVFFAQLRAEAGRQRERSARERVTDLFGRFVPKGMARELIDESGTVKPRTTEATAMMLDIADFTRFASSRQPEEVIAALNGFLATAADCVETQEGVVITFTGDGLLATFNAPLAVENPVQHALAAAQAIVRQAQHHGFTLRVGIASGPIASGSIGSQSRMAFTVYGDAVNRAARLEALCKEKGETLLIDAQSAKTLSATAAIKEVAEVTLRGFDAPQRVYTLRQ